MLVADLSEEHSLHLASIFGAVPCFLGTEVHVGVEEVGVELGVD